jgi:hypothetical protein
MFLKNDLHSFKTCIHENIFEKLTNTRITYWEVILTLFLSCFKEITVLPRLSLCLDWIILYALSGSLNNFKVNASIFDRPSCFNCNAFEGYFAKALGKFNLSMILLLSLLPLCYLYVTSL